MSSIATFVHERLKWITIGQSPPTSETEWLCVDIDGYKVVNVYKPPPIRLPPIGLQIQFDLGMDYHLSRARVISDMR